MRGKRGVYGVCITYDASSRISSHMQKIGTSARAMDCRCTLEIHVIALSRASPAIGPCNNNGLQTKPAIDAFPPNPDAQSQHEHA
jgi:hypothetical protein